MAWPQAHTEGVTNSIVTVLTELGSIPSHLGGKGELNMTEGQIAPGPESGAPPSPGWHKEVPRPIWKQYGALSRC